MDVESEIKFLKERNKKVDVDKAWETSLFRKITIVLITYILAVVLMIVIDAPTPYLNALVTTMGFFL